MGLVGCMTNIVPLFPSAPAQPLAVITPTATPKPAKRKRIRVRVLTGELAPKWQDWAKQYGQRA